MFEVFPPPPARKGGRLNTKLKLALDLIQFQSGRLAKSNSACQTRAILRKIRNASELGLRNVVVIPRSKPLAYVARMQHHENAYIAAPTASKARWIIIRWLKSVKSPDAMFSCVSVAREPRFDEWAKTAKPTPHCIEA